MSLLDNAVWHALRTRHARFADVVGRARRYAYEVSFASAVDRFDDESWRDIEALVGPGGTAVFFRDRVPPPPPGWTLVMEGVGHQMVLDHLVPTDVPPARLLTVADVPEMLELVALTRPGPFLPRTVELGDYYGVFADDRLVAMAGERLQLPGFTEIERGVHPSRRSRPRVRVGAHHQGRHRDPRPRRAAVPAPRGRERRRAAGLRTTRLLAPAAGDDGGGASTRRHKVTDPAFDPVLADRLAGQLLSGHAARDPVAVIERLVAVQAQDPRGARLTVRARSRGLSSAAVDRALTDDRSLIVAWLLRGTLHLVRREDYPWLHALTAPTIVTGNARRLAQEGVSADAAERGVTVVIRALERDGPLRRDELRARLDAAGIRTAGQAFIHVLLLASLRDSVVRGPMVGNEQAFVLARDWLGPPEPVAREIALAELARRYLAAHGPADERDLAKWSGLPVRDTRAGLRAAAADGDVVERPDGLLDRARRRHAARLPSPRLLGSFDPVLLGWKSRDAIVGAHKRVVTTNGIFRPIALIEGRAVGTWRFADDAVTLQPFAAPKRSSAGAISTDDEAALRAEADDALRYLGLAPRAFVVAEPGSPASG